MVKTCLFVFINLVFYFWRAYGKYYVTRREIHAHSEDKPKVRRLVWDLSLNIHNHQAKSPMSFKLRHTLCFNVYFVRNKKKSWNFLLHVTFNSFPLRLAKTSPL